MWVIMSEWWKIDVKLKLTFANSLAEVSTYQNHEDQGFHLPM